MQTHQEAATAAPTAEDFMAAMASKPLDLAEMDALVKKGQELWEIYEVKKKAASEAHAEYEKVEAAILAALKAAGKKSYKVDGLGTVTIVQKSQVTTPKTIDAKKAFFKYLREKGEDTLYALATVNANTLNSWFAQELARAAEAGVLGFRVPGIDDPTMRETMAFRKDAKKG